MDIWVRNGVGTAIHRVRLCVPAEWRIPIVSPFPAAHLRRARVGAAFLPTKPLSRHGGVSHMACARAWPRSRSLRRSPRSLVSDVGIPGLHVRLVGADAIAPSPPSAPVPNRGYHAPPPPGLPLPPLYASPRRVDGWDDVGGM